MASPGTDRFDAETPLTRPLAVGRIGVLGGLTATSAGMAWTLGRADNQVTLEEALEHLRLVAGAVAVPVNADFEGGYAVDPGAVADCLYAPRIDDLDHVSAAPWPAPPGAASWRRRGRSPTPGRSRGSTACPTSTGCSGPERAVVSRSRPRSPVASTSCILTSRDRWLRTLGKPHFPRLTAQRQDGHGATTSTQRGDD